MRGEVMRLKHTFKSYLLVILLGLLAGFITRLSDLFPSDTLWSLSSIATLFGFWMVTTTLVIYFSSSNKNAAINVFLYLASMNFSFYFLEGVFGLVHAQFSEIHFMNWHLFNTYTVIALVCACIGFVLYNWNKQNKISSVLYALPISGLLAETIGVTVYLYYHHTYLGQFIFDFLSFILLGGWFYKKAASKRIYIMTVLIVSLTGYFLMYHPFLGIS